MENNNLKDVYSIKPEQKDFNKKITVIIAAVAVIVCIITGIIGYVIGANKYEITDTEKELIDRIPLVSEVYGLLRDKYYKDITWEEVDLMVAAALAGSIDPFTGLYSMGAVAPSKPQFGFTVKENEIHNVIIQKIVPDSPAETAGLRRADKIISVKVGENVFNAEHKGVDAFSEFLAPATMLYEVQFTVERNTPEGAAQLTYNVRKDFINATQSDYVQLTEQIGYATLDSFSGSTDDFFRSMYRFNESTASKLILDLRGNGGGDSNVLASFAPFFIPAEYGSDIIKLNFSDGSSYVKSAAASVTVEDNGKAVEFNNSYLGGLNRKGDEFELIILTNGSSASASEALIGAVQYYDESVKTIGVTTYGKGVGQENYTVGGGRYRLAVTAGYYYIPVASGKDTEWVTIHGVGIQPDIKFSDMTITGEYITDPIITEAIKHFASGEING